MRYVLIFSASLLLFGCGLDSSDDGGADGRENLTFEMRSECVDGFEQIEATQPFGIEADMSFVVGQDTVTRSLTVELEDLRLVSTDGADTAQVAPVEEMTTFDQPIESIGQNTIVTVNFDVPVPFESEEFLGREFSSSCQVSQVE